MVLGQSPHHRSMASTSSSAPSGQTDVAAAPFCTGVRGAAVEQQFTLCITCRVKVCDACKDGCHSGTGHNLDFLGSWERGVCSCPDNSCRRRRKTATATAAAAGTVETAAVAIVEKKANPAAASPAASTAASPPASTAASTPASTVASTAAVPRSSRSLYRRRSASILDSPPAALGKLVGYAC
jgi:hypothetical protein